MCGEAGSGSVISADRVGLSPRVRGSRRRPRQAPGAPRIIPACAGKPSGRLAYLMRSWDYPRVCGEAWTATPNTSPSAGLSPRVRGSPASHRAGGRAAGIIPACAGKPSTTQSPASSCRDYPRVCGEAFIKRLRQRIDMGLSPRVRGSRHHPAEPTSFPGIIPACAGKPRPASACTPARRDYPRVCGEAELGISVSSL